VASLHLSPLFTGPKSRRPFGIDIALQIEDDGDGLAVFMVACRAKFRDRPFQTGNIQIPFAAIRDFVSSSLRLSAPARADESVLSGVSGGPIASRTDTRCRCSRGLVGLNDE